MARLGLICLACVAGLLRTEVRAPAATVIYQSQRFTGTANNRQITYTLLTQGTVTGSSTNPVFGTPIVVQPVNGAATNTLLASNYKLTIDGIPTMFPFGVPDSTNTYYVWDLVNAGIYVLVPTNVAAQAGIALTNNDTRNINFNGTFSAGSNYFGNGTALTNNAGQLMQGSITNGVDILLNGLGFGVNANAQAINLTNNAGYASVGKYTSPSVPGLTLSVGGVSRLDVTSTNLVDNAPLTILSGKAFPADGWGVASTGSVLYPSINGGAFTNLQNTVATNFAPPASTDGMAIISSNGAALWSKNAGLLTNQNASLFASGNSSASNVWNGSLVGLHYGSAQGNTNLPSPGWIRKNMQKPLMRASTYARFGAIAGAHDDWVTNTAYALFTNNFLTARSIDTISLEDLPGGWTRDGSGGLVPGSSYTVASITNMINFCHLCGIKVEGYLMPSRAQLTSTANGNPLSPLQYIYRDVLTNLWYGVDGILLDEAPDLDLDAIRQGQRLVTQAIFDYDANAVDGAKTNRATIHLLRALAPNSTPFVGGPLNFPYEVLDSLNVVSTAGQYVDPKSFTNLLYECHDLMTYNWYVGPGRYSYAFGFDPWNNVFTQQQDRNILNCFATMDTTVEVGGGFGGDFSTYQYLGDYTNAEFFSYWNDPASLPGYQVFSNALTEVWVRPLGATNSGTNLVCFINANIPTGTANVTCTPAMLGLNSFNWMGIRDPWSHTTLSNFTGSITVSVPNTNALLYYVYTLPLAPASQFVGPANSQPNAAQYAPGQWALWSYQTNGNTNVLVVSLRDTNSASWAANIPIAVASWWDPTNLPGVMAVWDVNALQSGVGVEPTSITDRYKYGFNLRRWTAGHQFWTNNPGLLNGLGFIHGDASFSGYTTNMASVAQPVTVFIVATAPSVTGGTIFDGEASRATLYQNGAGVEQAYSGSFGNNFGVFQKKWYIYEAVYNGASSFVKTNEVTADSGNYGANNLGGIHIGMNNSFSGVADLDWAYAIVVTNAVLSPYAEAQTWRWLNGRFGVYQNQNQNTFTGFGQINQQYGPIQSNVVTSPYLFTSAFPYKVMAMISLGTNNGVAKNGVNLGNYTNVPLNIPLFPNDTLSITNNGGRPNLFFDQY